MHWRKRPSPLVTLAAALLLVAVAARADGDVSGGSGGGGAPTGPCGGDLAGTYPDCTIAANAVALTTDTTGNYAAGDAEAGNATGLACSTCVDATDLAPRSVTFAKVQAIATGKLLGRSTASSGDVEELTVGTGLTLSGGTLSASGAASSGTGLQYGNGSGGFLEVTSSSVSGANVTLGGTLSGVTQLNVDNLRLDGNKLEMLNGYGGEELYMGQFGFYWKGGAGMAGSQMSMTSDSSVANSSGAVVNANTLMMGTYGGSSTGGAFQATYVYGGRNSSASGTGGNLYIGGGVSTGSTNGNGGDLHLRGGAKDGSGVPGNVYIGAHNTTAVYLSAPVIKIVPQATAPSTCVAATDLYTDTSGAFCFCTATNTWTNTSGVGACT